MASDERLDWIDISKGICIVLVVLWHSGFTEYDALGQKFHEVNQMLARIRMPLFILVSGLFVSKSIHLSWATLFHRRIKNFIYLYWVWGTILFFNREITKLILYKDPLSSSELSDFLLSLLLPTAETLWFIYALAVFYTLRKLTLKWNKYIVILFLVILYALSYDGSDWQYFTSFKRIFRFVPFFFLGYYSFSILNNVFKNFKYFYLLTLPIFFIISLVLIEENIQTPYNILGFLVSLIGMFGLLSISYMLQGSRVGDYIIFIGSNSLYIYLIHKVPVIHLKYLYFFLDLPFTVFGVLLITILSIMFSFLGKRILFMLNLAWLFNVNELAKHFKKPISAGG